MASQMNPIIAAFLQARSQAEDTFRGMQQQQLMQQRLQIEQEAQEAEAEYRRLNLQRMVDEAQQKAKEFDRTHKENQARNRANAANDILGRVKEGVLTKEGAGLRLGQEGFSSEEAQQLVAQLVDYEQRQIAERQAKVDEAKALIPVKAEETGAVTKAKAEAEQPYQFLFEEKKHKNQMEIEKFRAAERAAQTRFVQAQANARAANRNAAAKELGITSSVIINQAKTVDSHPIAKDTAVRVGAFNAMAQVPNDTSNPADDLNLIVGFAKLIDPSVVRPSEFETTREWIQGLPQVVKFKLQRFVNPDGSVALTPQARQNLKDAASDTVKGNLQVYLSYKGNVTKRIDALTNKPGAGELIVGNPFDLPPQVKKVDDVYYWIEPGKKPVQLYKEK